MSERIDLGKINDFIHSYDLELCIFMDPVLGHHMTGWMPFERRDWTVEERALIFVFIKNQEPFIIFRNSSFSGYKPLTKIKQIYPCHLLLEEKSKVLVEQLKKRGFKSGKIGIETDIMPVRTYDFIGKAFPKATFCDISAFSRGLCVKKDFHQIDCIQKALSATEKGFQAIFRHILRTFPEKKFISRLKLERIFRRTILKYDAQVYDEEMSMDDAQLKKGDRALFDMVVRYNGLLSDFSLGLYLGYKLPPVIQREQDRAYKIIDTVASVLKPDMTIGEAEVSSDNALQKAFGNSCNREKIAERWVVHGIGLSIHAEPRFGRDYRGRSRKEARKIIKIEPGCVMVVEICGFGEELFLMEKERLKKLGLFRTGVYSLTRMRKFI